MNETDGLGTKAREGKTKIIYNLPGNDNMVLIVSKDDITAKDGAEKDEIPGKGEIANKTTCSVFLLLGKNNIPTHFVASGGDDFGKNAFLAWKCKMIPMEVVIRRIATGSFLKRNPGVKEGEIFFELVVEFFLKDDANHDPFIVVRLGGTSWELWNAKEPIDQGTPIKFIKPLVSEKEVEKIRSIARRVFLILEAAWKRLDITFWDLKIEFGIRVDSGEIVVADVIDNDSWRIRDKEGRQLDKQVYRDKGISEKLRDNYNLVAELAEKFKEMEITKDDLEKDQTIKPRF